MTVGQPVAYTSHNGHTDTETQGHRDTARTHRHRHRHIHRHHLRVPCTDKQAQTIDVDITSRVRLAVLSLLEIPMLRRPEHGVELHRDVVVAHAIVGIHDLHILENFVVHLDGGMRWERMG